MGNDTKIASMEKELDEIQNELDVYEKALKADGSGKTSQPASVEQVKTAATGNSKSAGSRLPQDERSATFIKEISKEIEAIKKKLEQLDEISNKLELLDEMDEELNYIKNFMDTRLNVDFEAMYHNLLEQMNIEAIKIYRNIQAVIVEEDAKQNHVLFGVDGKSDKLKSRMNHVMIFSIISFVVSILVMIMQILPAFGIHLF